MSLAKTFERLKKDVPAGDTHWDADSERGEPCFALLVDGFNSSSASHLASTQAWSRVETPMRPFSYFHPGRKYSWRDTWDDPLVPAKLLATSYLTGLRAGQSVRPIGCSLGGIVALLGTAMWAQESVFIGVRPASIRELVPVLVMVAPALCPPRRLLEQYEALRHDGSVLEVPMVIRRLSDVPHPTRQGLQAQCIAAIELLASLDIEMHEVVCPDDEVCPSHCSSELDRVRRTYVQRHVLPCGGDGGGNQDDDRASVMRHVRFLQSDAVASLADCLACAPGV